MILLAFLIKNKTILAPKKMYVSQESQTFKLNTQDTQTQSKHLDFTEP